MNAKIAPVAANWDITYACQLRCGYCYTESGRRAIGTPAHEDVLRIADVLGSMKLGSVQLSGGEPLLMRNLSDIVDRIRAHGTKVAIYTNGLLVNDDNAHELCDLFYRIHVSLDGATAEVHDKIRARKGAFAGATSALECLDRAARERRASGRPVPRFGFDTVIVQSNFHEIEALCTDIAHRFPNMAFITLGAAVPSGLATMAHYAKTELLTVEQLAQLRDDAFKRKIQGLVPAHIDVDLTDNYVLSMAPELVAESPGIEKLMHVEADGGVRSMAIYEGTVGNLLNEPPDVLWDRVLEARRHPVVVEALSSIDTMEKWADAARRIDMQFASEPNRQRILLRVTPNTT
ncbi:MAG TPA: radical SAM protein [Polyangium sp.]|nr:radical SAM protein [Polyangium sp.]